MDPVNVYLPNLKFEALPVPEIIGGMKKIYGLLFGWTLRMYRPHLQSVSLPVPEMPTQNCNRSKRGGRRGRDSIERALVSSCGPSVVTFHLFI